MNISLQTKYFLIAIITVGSIGIWLPFLLAVPLNKELDLSSIPLNLTTFYVSIYFAGCVDLILKHIDGEDKIRTKSQVLNMIFLILLSVALIITTVWTSISGQVVVPVFLASVGTIIALRLWWLSNIENPSFNDQIRKEVKIKHGNDW